MSVQILRLVSGGVGGTQGGRDAHGDSGDNGDDSCVCAGSIRAADVDARGCRARPRCVVRHHDDRPFEVEGVLRQALRIGSSIPFAEAIRRLRLSRADRLSGRFELRTGRSVRSTAWSMFRCREFRKAARRRQSWVERSFPDSPSTCQTALAPSVLSVIQPDIPWGCPPEHRSRRRSLLPGDHFAAGDAAFSSGHVTWSERNDGRH